MAVAKTRKSAEALERMILMRLPAPGAAIKVHPDPTFGWRVQTISTPPNAPWLRDEAEIVAHDLRVQFELKR
jgi:hypothetical protein